VQSPKPWRLAASALTAVAVLVGIAVPAFAAEPGETSTWTAEQVRNDQGGLSDLYSNSSEGQAWVDGDEVQVWEANTNPPGSVEISNNGGDPFTLGSTATWVSPVVVPYGNNQVMIIQSGTDGKIYYTFYSPAANVWTGYWMAVPAQSTWLSVSATQEGTDSTNVYMVYRSSNSSQIWGTLWNGSSWQQAVNIAGGTSSSNPSVAWNNYSNPGLWVVDQGTDGNYYITQGVYDGSSWSRWTYLGGYSSDPATQPTIAVIPNTGNMLVSYVDDNENPVYMALDSYGNFDNWSTDITGWQTTEAVTLIGRGNAIYALLTGLDGAVYWKQVYYVS
jgi:hypothetical protein